MLGVVLTRWTIRLALACYFVVLAGGIVARDRGRWQPVARRIWVAGCLLFLAHVACAFHFYPDWSHVQALHHTAVETERMIGWPFGEGIYFSYAFALLWIFVPPV